MRQRCFLVTGASSGIGRAIARKLLLLGHQVIGTSRDCTRFCVANPLFSAFHLDLSRTQDLHANAVALQKRFPQIDGVIFAAGIGQFGSLEEFSFAQIEHLLTVNFTANALLTRALLPNLKKQPHSDLIYIGSEAALKGSRKGTVYCASKFALRGFTQALREECAKSRLRVTLINPGMVQTPFFDGLNFEPGSEPGHFIEAKDVAQAVEYIIDSNPAIVIDEINLSPLQKVIHFKESKK